MGFSRWRALVALCGVWGLAGVQGMSAGPSIDGSLITAVAHQVRLRHEGTVFLRPHTDPIFFFHSLPDLGVRRGLEIEHEHRDRYAPVDVNENLFRPGGFERYTADDCDRDTRGVWIQYSPIVVNPVTGDPGLFLRVTERPCSRWSGTQYWVRMVDCDEGSEVELIRLEVVEH